MSNEQLQRQCDILRAERDQARARSDSTIKVLLKIHALLYPPSTKTSEGQTFVFRPKDPDPHIILQELSDRIRALPDEIEAHAEARAHEILGKAIQPNENLDTPKDAYGDRVWWHAENIEVILHGRFTADELEAIAWWMRNKGEVK